MKDLGWCQVPPPNQTGTAGTKISVWPSMPADSRCEESFEIVLEVGAKTLLKSAGDTFFDS